MKPEQRSKNLLGITRSQAKMYEYSVPSQYHIAISRDPARLFPLTIGLIGDFASQICSKSKDEGLFIESQNHLNFAAYFFDAYLESKLNRYLDPYTGVMSSAAYYLCDLPGSSHVLAKRIDTEALDLDCQGLERLMAWLLKGDFTATLDRLDGVYGEYINEFSSSLIGYYVNGSGEQRCHAAFEGLRTYVYNSGTPRQLLFADILCALGKKRLVNSTWYCLPRYSGLSLPEWLPILQKKDFIKELWPAQHLLGAQGVFQGKSAVVQMPTSAGKTRATEIIIRSAFLSKRTVLTVIVAPFKALCHEIRDNLGEAFRDESVDINELSDVLQTDFEIDIASKRNEILVITPEKLLYVLRHIPELAKKIGLLIYDEGHQFDSPTRGVTYELLLTSLKTLVSDSVQTVLISAVISNAESINNWLNGGDAQIVSGTNLNPTYRTLAFTSWLDQLGRLDFVSPENPEQLDFFVPRVIEQFDLNLRHRERKRRKFPEKEDGRSVALYLGLKLMQNGSVAIFCGTKATAAGFCEKIIEAYDRGLSLRSPDGFSDPGELRRLCFLYERSLGPESPATLSAKLGVFTHHGNTPHGIRLAVEYAMKEGLIRFVVCTSTLAQGVNLPIRYLIVASIYQGVDRIKVRDFHNLIGRAGRSGMHTEGSIIFADHEVYDKRYSRDDKWKWVQVRNLLEPKNSEPCVSTLLSIFEPLRSDDERYTIRMEPLDFAKTYVDNPSELNDLPVQFAKEHADKGFSQEGLERQIKGKIHIIAAIESYLMAHWDESGSNISQDNIDVLARGTLAYYLSDEENRNRLIELFRLLAINIEKKVTDAVRRKVFGITLYGISDSLMIEAWVNENIEQLIAAESHEQLLEVLWPVLVQHIQNLTFRRCDKAQALKELAFQWIQGVPFCELFKILTEANCKIGHGKRPRNPQIEYVVDICENALSYDGMLLVGAITEFCKLIHSEKEDLIENLQWLQKRLKYGLSSPAAISLYELGFADQVIATDLSSVIGTAFSRREAIKEIRKNEDKVRELLNNYPRYFNQLLNNLLLEI
ncbi:MAG: DEAD/DEAH box helicase [Candidatus Omnitrophica bacterium]|nr:DEAD/DEAH box helicase [Candidatus Omnitrophota bacterium]